MNLTRLSLLSCLLVISFFVRSDDIGTSFTYQGELQHLGVPANGFFDFQFDLYNTEIDGSPLTTTVHSEDTAVKDGVFTVELDFGSAAFSSDQLWLEISVREGVSTGDYTGLSPRQKLTAVPNALRAESVAMGSVGVGEINETEVQRRIESSCQAGTAIREVNPDGTVSCADNFITVTEQSRTISIPADYPGLGEAFAALQKEHISPGSKVTLQLSTGTYSYTEPLKPSHPDGVSIEILGDQATPSNVVLYFSDSNGLILSGTYLSLIDGVTIHGNQAGAPYDKIGIKASAGATVNLGINVIVEGFDIGMQAENGGSIMAEQTTASNNALHGYVAISGGVIHANGASATGNGGNGFFAFNNGTIIANTSIAENNGDAGFQADVSGTITADSSQAENNTGSGFSASINGTIHAFEATSTGNGSDGFIAKNSGTIFCHSALATNNGASGFAAFNGSSISVQGGQSIDNINFGYNVRGLSIIDAVTATSAGNGVADLNQSPNLLSPDGALIMQ